ncbi:MAG: anhydro-N-acetylmuramic acid kinase [Acidobacteria bacterium]|nr:MAG: anhydro-N-acetylmuramic acid kinase [Acidobacteriota bacterium]
MTRAPEESRLALGLMSGTSVDGIDVALVRISPTITENAAHARLENFVTLPFPTAVRAEVLRIAEGARVSPGEISQLNFRLGRVFADAALRACRKFRVHPRRLSVIGSHGQTIFHQGRLSRFLGQSVASTLQIGEPAMIAAITGVITVGDFRPADMAVGGQGAPLVPWLDYLLYRDAHRGRAVLNIGGIANVTIIPKGASPRSVMAFDTGPGNMVIDALVRQATSGRRSFDAEAQMASRGQLLPGLLDALLAEPYFRQAPPKSAGREQYGKAYVEKILGWGRRHRARPEDLVRTATVLTALSIADALHRWVLPRTSLAQLIVSGGGARNPLVLAQLSAALGGIEVVTTEALGLPGDAKEAFIFALLADETVHGRPANLPSATGATRPAILGKICYPPPR